MIREPGQPNYVTLGLKVVLISLNLAPRISALSINKSTAQSTAQTGRLAGRQSRRRLNGRFDRSIRI
ncbi:unnamed protein product, partial [Nesidiocoris tenuis]